MVIASEAKQSRILKVPDFMGLLRRFLPTLPTGRQAQASAPRNDT
jgi:hypothetical protein